MRLESILAQQDSVITRRQALEYLTDHALQHRLRRGWQILLPGVYLAVTGTPTPRQWRIAALVYGGDGAQLADATALEAYGVRYLPPDTTIRLLLPASERRANRDGVTVRRTQRLPPPRNIEGLRFSPPARALSDLTARVNDDRLAVAVVADAIQRQIATAHELVSELRHVCGRGAGAAHRMIAWIEAGVRSAPEADFLDICRRSRILPTPLVNPLLELPSGRRISPDTLFLEAGLVHETNGRAHHAAEDRFDDMQARHGAMSAAGLIVLHSSPRQLLNEPDRVLAEVEACYQRYKDAGLPAGVNLLRDHAA